MTREIRQMLTSKTAALLLPVVLLPVGLLSARAAATSEAPAPWSLRINAGGPAVTDAAGRQWAADDYFVGGTAAESSAAIDNTDAPEPYRTERYGASGYRIPVPAPGIYQLTLSFADSWATAPGQRVFSVEAEGQTVVPDLDLVSAVGPATAYDATMAVRTDDSFLDLGFSATANNALVNGIQVSAARSAAVASPPVTWATSLSSVRRPGTSVSGDRTTCSGRLTRTQSGAPVAGAPITLTLRPEVGPARVVTARTDANGAWSTVCALVWTTTVQAAFAGDTDDRPATTTYRTGVAPRIVVGAPASGAVSSTRQALVVRGTISPNKAGRTLGLYRLVSGGGWRLVALGVVARDGSWRCTAALPRGDYRLLVHIGNTVGSIAGSSPSFVVHRR